jgi:hypothetical protein
MTLGGRESPEYRFGGPNFFQFLKEKRKNFAIFKIKGHREIVNKPLRGPKKLMYMESTSLNTMVKSDRRWVIGKVRNIVLEAPTFSNFKEKRHKKAFCLFSDRFCGLICSV